MPTSHCKAQPSSIGGYFSFRPNSNDTFVAAPDTFITYPRTSGQDKKKYDVGVLSGKIVHDDNLFDVYLGESIAPYVTLAPLTAALPVDKPSMTLPLDHSLCPLHPKTGNVRHNACVVDTAQLDSRMRSRWNTMSSLWDANKGKNDKKSLYGRLNYHNILTSQLAWLRDPGNRPFRIAYTTSGEPTAAIISSNEAVLDTKLYQVTCRNIDEAYYLLAIINSDTLTTAVEPFRARGLFGARDLHKHLWKLPIPAYDPNDQSHADLSNLGKRAATEAEKIIADLGTPSPSVTKARSILRHEWQPNSPANRNRRAAVVLMNPTLGSLFRPMLGPSARFVAIKHAKVPLRERRNGRWACLRSMWLRPCGFESRLPTRG